MNFLQKRTQSKWTPLKNVALSKITDWIVSQATQISKSVTLITEESLSQHIANIRIHLKNKMPKNFHNKFAAEVIKALIKLSNVERKQILDETEMANNNVIGRLIETLFNDNLTCLSFDRGLEIFETSLISKSYLLNNLTDLKYNGVMMLDDKYLAFLMTLNEDFVEELQSLERHMPSEHTDLKYNGVTVHYDTLFVQLLKNLHNLKHLTLNNYNQCLEEILICVTENCMLIEELNLRDSTAINDNCMNIINKLPNLRSIDLVGTKVGDQGIATLLLTCPNIEELHAWGVESAIEHIASLKESTGKHFKLKHLYSFFGTTLQQLQIVVKMCPLIQKVILMKEHISVLYDVQDLNNLELEWFHFYSDEIKEFLQVKGYNLKRLSLENIEQLDLNAFMCIYQSCPNLESINISECSFQEVRILHNEIFNPKNPVFRNLNRSSLHTLDWLLTDEQILFLLSHSINVEFPEENEQYLFTDDNSIPPDRSFYLKEFTLCFCTTKLILHRFVENSIKCLEVVAFEMYRI